MNSYYYKRDQLFVSPSISDSMETSAYYSAERDKAYQDKDNMAELVGTLDSITRPVTPVPYVSTHNTRPRVAVYYGMVEEVDEWLGRLLDHLMLRGVWNNTLIIFTGDHGEMLGAHGKLGKENFYEESVRVPMILSLPNNANSGKRVSVPTSLLDLHSTILDYLEAPAGLDTSDGNSLRRFIEATSFNEDYDETVVVSEYEYNADSHNKKTYGYLPAFMIRKGDFKLILPRIAKSPLPDMLYNLKTDRYVSTGGGREPR